MWFDQTATDERWAEAVAHLRHDPAMRVAVDQVGPCTLKPRRDPFVLLCKSIFAQQVSTAAATAMFNRFAARFPRKRPVPALVHAALGPGGWDDETIRSCGISRQKRGYLLDLAAHFHDGRIPAAKLRHMEDERAIEMLTAVRGVGVWTVEMLLIFGFNRPDVWPVDDLGIREGVKRVLKLPERPTPKECVALGETWRPWRSIASWYLWRFKGD